MIRGQLCLPAACSTLRFPGSRYRAFRLTCKESAPDQCPGAVVSSAGLWRMQEIYSRLLFLLLRLYIFTAFSFGFLGLARLPQGHWAFYFNSINCGTSVTVILPPGPVSSVFFPSCVGSHATKKRRVFPSKYSSRRSGVERSARRAPSPSPAVNSATRFQAGFGRIPSGSPVARPDD